jgi:hypothetical protein
MRVIFLLLTGVKAGNIILNIAAGKETLTTFVPIDELVDTAGDLLERVGELVGIPSDYIVLYKRTNLFQRNKLIGRDPSQRIGCSSTCTSANELNAKTLPSLGVSEGSSVLCLIRPLRGDHIHQAFAVYVHDELVDTLWDSDWLRTPDASEGLTYPKSFEDLSDGMHDYHITTTHPHFGIHSGQAQWFGDGFIHIHPGTSWCVLVSSLVY